MHWNYVSISFLFVKICFRFIEIILVETAEIIGKCDVGDDSCIANTFTQLIQQSGGKFQKKSRKKSELQIPIKSCIIFAEIPELNIPALAPYASPVNSFSSATSKYNLPISFTCKYENVSIAGINNIIVEEIRFVNYTIHSALNAYDD